MAKKLSVRQRVKKYVHELKTGWRKTNDGHPKMGRNGRQLRVTKTGEAYRKGYIKARNDCAAAARAAAKKKTVSPSSPTKSKKSNPYNDFEYTDKGRIKGSYTSDGFFEPD